MLRSKARITSKGRVTLPIEVRTALGVDQGDDVVFEEREGRITVAPARRTRSETMSFVRNFEAIDVIGAHALELGALITYDAFFATQFPEVRLITA